MSTLRIFIRILKYNVAEMGYKNKKSVFFQKKFLSTSLSASVATLSSFVDGDRIL